MNILAGVVLVVGVVVLLALVMTIPFMIAWGIIAPVFGLPTLSFIQSWAMLTVVGGLFKSVSSSN